MDLITDYHSDDSDPVSQDVKAVRAPVTAAPHVSVTARLQRTTALLPPPPSSSSSTSLVARRPQGDSLILANNPKKSVLYQPAYGPYLSAESNSKTIQKQALETNICIDETTFHEQRTSFQATGQALAPETGNLVQRTALGYDSKRLEAFAKQDEQRAKKRLKLEAAAKEPSTEEYASDDEVVFGVWAPPSKEEQWAQENALTDIQKGVELAPEQLAEREYITERNRQRGEEEQKMEEVSSFERMVERKMAHLLPPRKQETAFEPTTTFHGQSETDYKNRSWMAPPAGLGSILADKEHITSVDHHKCKVPKKCVAKFTGHNNGVHRIRLFPKTGHLLLSAGLDGKCKVWDVERKQVMRTYIGHSAAVRDVQFNHSGTKFVSASFDRYLRLWDTESGKVLQTFGNGKVPYCVEFYPEDDNFFVVGCSDNKIIAYNATTGEISQEYNHHLAPVNAILFVEDQGTKMITTGDDKKVLVWEWDIGVPIKYISDPTMHSMPCLALHPALQFFVGQSLDNTIAVFQANKRFALQKKKKFSGHIVSGYACQMAFSPDGQYLVSGDGNGNVYLWDWKRHKILQKYKAHNQGPAICCAWHPLEPSTMFTCGWDGVIKMWQ